MKIKISNFKLKDRTAVMAAADLMKKKLTEIPAGFKIDVKVEEKYDCFIVEIKYPGVAIHGIKIFDKIKEKFTEIDENIKVSIVLI